jgi:midasin (ATPase involved in ribosome maturation)
MCCALLYVCRRLLDDNRELFVPELNEVIRPHPHFMLFATQVGEAGRLSASAMFAEGLGKGTCLLYFSEVCRIFF